MEKEIRQPDFGVAFFEFATDFDIRIYRQENAVSQNRNSFRWRSFLFHVLAVSFFLVPAGVGFTVKYLDLLILFGSGDDGAFAIVPIMNYLLCSLGFIMLFFWAVRHGMFREIEQMKHKMLERELELDAAEQETAERTRWE